MRRKLAWALGIVAALLVGALVALYLLGTPSVQADPPGDGTAAARRAATEPTGDVKTAVPATVPEPDPSSPLAIQIPGCVCHSDDPKLVKEHQEYRMNQCAGCHAGGVPTRP